MTLAIPLAILAMPLLQMAQSTPSSDFERQSVHINRCYGREVREYKGEFYIEANDPAFGRRWENITGWWRQHRSCTNFPRR
jgi:hypothetical protein